MQELEPPELERDLLLPTQDLQALAQRMSITRASASDAATVRVGAAPAPDAPLPPSTAPPYGPGSDRGSGCSSSGAPEPPGLGDRDQPQHQSLAVQSVSTHGGGAPEGPSPDPGPSTDADSVERDGAREERDDDVGAAPGDAAPPPGGPAEGEAGARAAEGEGGGCRRVLRAVRRGAAAVTGSGAFTVVVSLVILLSVVMDASRHVGEPAAWTAAIQSCEKVCPTPGSFVRRGALGHHWGGRGVFWREAMSVGSERAHIASHRIA